MDDPRAAEGVEHLQVAARELIAAARLFLDAIEDVVDEPERMTDSVAGIVEFVKGATSSGSQPWESHAWATGSNTKGWGSGSGDEDAPHEAPQGERDGTISDPEVDIASKPAASVPEKKPGASVPEKKPGVKKPGAKKPESTRRGPAGVARSTVKRIPVD